MTVVDARECRDIDQQEEVDGPKVDGKVEVALLVFRYSRFHDSFEF
jgi:hypothetical protein